MLGVWATEVLAAWLKRVGASVGKAQVDGYCVRSLVLLLLLLLLLVLPLSCTCSLSLLSKFYVVHAGWTDPIRVTSQHADFHTLELGSSDVLDDLLIRMGHL